MNRQKRGVYDRMTAGYGTTGGSTRVERIDPNALSRIVATASSVATSASSGSSAVKLAQSQLRTLGYAIAVDGKMGSKTTSALKSFQRSVGIAVDGKLGPITKSALSAAVKAKVSEQYTTSTSTSTTSNTITTSSAQGKNKKSGWGWAILAALAAAGSIL